MKYFERVTSIDAAALASRPAPGTAPAAVPPAAIAAPPARGDGAANGLDADVARPDSSNARRVATLLPCNIDPEIAHRLQSRSPPVERLHFDHVVLS
jgi:hypothetical protein